MGKAQSRPQHDREPLREGHEITFPVNVECTSKPSLNRRFEVTVRYSVETVLYDVLKQIERRITSSKQQPSDRGKLKISAVTKRSFLRHRIDLNDSKDNKTRLRALQYRSITSYSEKAIRREGVHCEVQMERAPLRAIRSANGGPNVSKSSKSRPLSSSSSSSNPNKPNRSGSGSTTKHQEALRKRLETLKKTEESAYGLFDEIQNAHDQRDRDRLEMLRQKETRDGVKVAFKEGDLRRDNDSAWGGLPWRLRDVLLDWFFDLQSDLNLHDETIFAALQYIDLHLVRRQMKQLDLQLLGVTACCLASKTYEIIPQPMSEWLYLSHDQYRREQMISLERQLLKSINWTVFQVTPICYVMPWLHVMGLDHGRTTKSANKSHSKNKENACSEPEDEYLSQRVLIHFLIRAGAMTSAYLSNAASVVAAAAITLSFVYLRRDEGDQSKRNNMNIPKTKPSEHKWTMSTATKQAPLIAMLAAASKLDLRGNAVSKMMDAIHERVCRLLMEKTKDASISALYKSCTAGNDDIEKRFGPRARSLDIRTLNIPQRTPPFQL